MKGRGIQLKYKILALLTLVPLVTLGGYLLMAIKVFEKDKLAYVFETTFSSARTLGSQTEADLNNILISAKPIIQEFVLQGNFGNVAKSIFASDGSMEWISAFSKDSQGKFQRVGLSEKLLGVGDQDLVSFGNIQGLLEEASSTGRLIRVPFKDDRVLLAEKVGDVESGVERIFLVMSRLSALTPSFRNPSSAQFYLVNGKSFVLFGPTGSEATYLSEKMPPSFLNFLDKKKSTSSTEQLQASGGQELLASFARVNFGDLTVVSMVDRKEALLAVEILIRRSLVFFVLMISASTIVSLFASGSLTSAITDLFNATKKVAEGNFAFRVQARSNDEVGSLARSFNAMAEEVERLMGETAEKARMQGELKTAQTVQETLFPASFADLNGFQVSGFYEPASECGGDWWHYCRIENKVLLWIGDATGHGAPAALITSAAKSAATIIERLNVDPAHGMELLNRSIFEVSKGRIMMTFFLASYDLNTRELVYSNASHEAPFLIKNQEGQIKKRDLIPLNEVNNPRLGQEIDTKYEQTKITLDPGDRVLFYTDGIPDIESPEKKSWGEREFIKGIISSVQGFPLIEKSVKDFASNFSAFRQGTTLKDDITFFLVSVPGGFAKPLDFVDEPVVKIALPSAPQETAVEVPPPPPPAEETVVVPQETPPSDPAVPGIPQAPA
jgi:sigma-B regulation protein RsbU (phosphoserine phosphatase)